MAIPIALRYEAQYATSGRAKCQVCGQSVRKGDPVVKVLGFRINHTIHPMCIVSMVNTMQGETARNQDVRIVRASGKGEVKIGRYTKQAGSYRWVTLTKLNWGDTNAE